jgi:hypothetical protein
MYLDSRPCVLYVWRICESFLLIQKLFKADLTASIYLIIGVETRVESGTIKLLYMSLRYINVRGRRPKSFSTQTTV